MNDVPKSQRQTEGDQTSWTDDGEFSETGDESLKLSAKVSSQSRIQSRDQVKNHRHSVNTASTNPTPLMNEKHVKSTGKQTQAMLGVLKKRDKKSETPEVPRSPRSRI